MPPSHPRRPAFLGKVALESLGGSPDPAEIAEVAHQTASLLVDAGRRSTDAAERERLVRLVDDVGLDTIAEMWSSRPARSLPGALWRLYAVREWVCRDTVGAAADFAGGREVAAVSSVVAGAADPPTPDAVRDLVDAVLHGVFSGELDVALERAGAFCRVVVAGRVRRADELEAEDPERAATLTRAAASLRDTAEDLEASAMLWRAKNLV